SSGPGDQSRIYHTIDAGQHWNLQFTSTNPKAFFDSIAFWDPTHGIVLGDPIPDDSGQLKFQLLITADGQSWTPIPPSQLPPALEAVSLQSLERWSGHVLSWRVVLLHRRQRFA